MIRNFKNDTKGVLAVQAAFVLPVLLLIACLGTDLALGVSAKTSLQAATIEAARATAWGANAQQIFAADLPAYATNGTVTCSINSGIATCHGAAQYTYAFAGFGLWFAPGFQVPTSSAITATGQAAVPPPSTPPPS
jgi:Flp pilus assembly protein TadG